MQHRLLTAALLGAGAGMRSMLPLLGLAFARRSGWLRRSPAGVAPRVASALAAGAELVNDKRAAAGERTAPASVVARVGSGALAAALLARRSHARPASALRAGLVAAAAALASTFLFHRLRVAAARHLPAPVAAVTEDLLATAMVALALRR